jgi:PKD repeat protein
MKSKIIIGLIILASISSCKKTDTISTEPQSSFKVSNQSNNTVNEGQVLKLTDQSVNAASYHWDFGNGTTSDKADPNFYYVMHGDYTITLTVTNVKGTKATSKYDITVLCTYGNPNHTALPAPTM